jgi:hypothetical protein
LDPELRLGAGFFSEAADRVALDTRNTIMEIRKALFIMLMRSRYLLKVQLIIIQGAILKIGELNLLVREEKQ